MCMARKRRKLTKKQRERRNKWIVRILIALLVFLLGFFAGRGGGFTNALSESVQEWRDQVSAFFREEWQRDEASFVTEQDTVVRFLDVGQGSATLFQAEDGTNILVDSGRYDDEDRRILQYLDQYIGTGGKIDLLIFTHNDADHIGYGDRILQYYDVEEVWMNGVDTMTRVYERVLDTLLETDAEYTEPRTGETWQEGAFYIEVLHPDPQTMTQDSNEQSIVARIAANGLSVMITGDVSQAVEQSILDKGIRVNSDVLLMGHHGSTYSSGEDWIKEVDPEMAVYSAGAGNPYGHPHDDTLERYAQFRIPVYGTIEHGTITMEINKNGQYTLQVEREAAKDESGT